MNKRSDETTAPAGDCDVRVVDENAVAHALECLPTDAGQQRFCGIFAALGDATRARILMALASGDLCVCDLAEVAGVSESAVSHQLRILRDLRLVTWTREGKRAVYRLADDHVRDLLVIGRAHAEEEL